MAARGDSRRGRVRVRGGRFTTGSPDGRGRGQHSSYMYANNFFVLQSDDDGDSVTFEDKDDNDRSKERPDKKRQRISTGTSADDNLMDHTDTDTDDFMTLSTDRKLAAIFTKISNTEVKVDSIYKENLCRRVGKVENVITTHEHRIKLLEYRSIDSEARNRRRNLLFKGIREYGGIENCFELVRDFIVDRLNITQDMYLERAHRLGSLKANQSRPRPIIVAFRDFYDTELILQAAPELKGSQYSVCRDYPNEISEARNKLWPHYRKARENPSAKVSIRYPARLVVDGVTCMICFLIGSLS